jgi:recombinational DNA repair ATPase RecF
MTTALDQQIETVLQAWLDAMVEHDKPASIAAFNVLVNAQMAATIGQLVRTMFSAGKSLDEVNKELAALVPQMNKWRAETLAALSALSEQHNAPSHVH